MRRTVLFSLTASLCLTGILSAQQIDTAAIRKSMSVYANDSAPGCALAIGQRGVVLFQQAWGSADLEHGVPNTVATIFEAGSVSKQFTAAAVLLLFSRGRLELTDDIRRYFPEIRDYGSPITIRDLLQHTSGLRDWGAIAALGGWPRGTRAANHAIVLDIIARQSRLNFPVDSAYSYTNSGYNLLAMLVERVTKESLAEFTRREFFVPLGMMHTSWRDDFTRIVSGRAQAYAGRPGEWRLDMPFENVYGNSSLLTTVGDLLIWNEAPTARKIGTPDVSRIMETVGVLRDGKAISYGAGLFIRTVNQVAEIGHDGATAGYRAFLARYPESGVSVALLCNTASADPVTIGRGAVTSLVRFAAPRPNSGLAPSRQPANLLRLDGISGRWHSADAAVDYQFIVRGSELLINRWPGDTLRVESDPRTGWFVWGTTTMQALRDTRGVPTELLISVDRARNVSFIRKP